MGAGEGHRGEMANPAWASHRDPRCLQGWTPTCQVSKPNAAAPPQPPGRSRATPSHPVPGAAAPGSPLAHPRAGAACREQAAEREQRHRHQPSPAGHRRPSPAPAGHRVHAAAPRTRRPHQDARTARVAPRTCRGHPDPRHGGLVSFPLPRAQHPRGTSPAPPGQAGPARACRAAGNRLGRSWWLRWASPEPAAPWARSPRGHEQTPNQPPGATALPGDTGGTSTYPGGSIPRAAMGDSLSWGGMPQLGDPSSVPGGHGWRRQPVLVPSWEG